MDNCICKGNWQSLVAECDPLFGKMFKDKRNGELYVFFGLVWAQDDFYYGMTKQIGGQTYLMSCVANFDQHDLEMVE